MIYGYHHGLHVLIWALRYTGQWNHLGPSLCRPENCPPSRWASYPQNTSVPITPAFIKTVKSKRPNHAVTVNGKDRLLSTRNDQNFKQIIQWNTERFLLKSNRTCKFLRAPRGRHVPCLLLQSPSSVGRGSHWGRYTTVYCRSCLCFLLGTTLAIPTCCFYRQPGIESEVYNKDHKEHSIQLHLHCKWSWMLCLSLTHNSQTS